MPDAFTYGPERVYVPICIRHAHGYYGGPAGYEERSDETTNTDVIIVDARKCED